MAKILADPLIEALRTAGVADDNTRRVVIDVQSGHVPVVYIERYGDEQLLDVASVLASVEIKRIEG